MASPIDQLGPGTGTANDPYIIKDLATLDAMRNDNSAHYMMVADVDLTGENWLPFDFSGVLDGRGFKIVEFQCTTSGPPIIGSGNRNGRGLFSNLHSRALVKNLSIYTGGANHVQGAADVYAGVLAGNLTGNSTVRNILVVGEVTSSSAVHGGLVGSIIGASDSSNSVRSCIALVDLSAGSYKGAISGWVSSAEPAHDGLVYSSDISSASESEISGAIDLSLAELASSASYPPAFDFDHGTWDIDENGYPCLVPQPVPIIEVAVGGGGDTPARVAGNVTINRAGAARSLVVISEDGTGARRVAGQGESETDGTFDITFDGWGRDVFVVALDEYGQAFEASAALNQGEIVHPTTPNGYVYEVTTAGTTGATEPTWSTDSAVTSGGVTFNPLPYYRPVASGPLTAEPV